MTSPCEWCGGPRVGDGRVQRVDHTGEGVDGPEWKLCPTCIDGPFLELCASFEPEIGPWPGFPEGLL